MSISKVVIGPSNTKAIKFFEDLNHKKAEFNKRAEAKLNKFIAAKKQFSLKTVILRNNETRF